ncbi:hypothetical protein IID27_03045, partial [Patescibacteria group bacterium]|nr:hypothetical protein [Patescibacteria group bacterium]
QDRVRLSSEDKRGGYPFGRWRAWTNKELRYLHYVQDLCHPTGLDLA